MAAISGLGSGIAWTGYTGLYASTGYLAPHSFTLNIDGGTFPTTASNTSGVIVATNGALPYSWGGTISFYGMNPPQSGYSGSVSWGAGNYSTNVREWSIDISWTEKKVTAFGSPVLAHSYIPTLASWRGTFAGYVDGTAALAPPTLPNGTIQTLTLMLFDEATNDDKLTGTAIVRQLGAAIGVATGGDFSYSFEGTGQLTSNPLATYWGVASSGIFHDTTGALVTPTAGQITLTAASGRTYGGASGGLAFPTRLSMNCTVDAGISGTIDFRGTGALAIDGTAIS